MNTLNIHTPLSRMLREFNVAPGGLPAGFCVDIEEDKKQYRLRADLPGAEKNCVSVNVEDNVLTVSAKLERQSENAVRSERIGGDVARAFRLPRMVDLQNIKASMKNGVLTVVLPKSEPAGHKIEIH